MATAGFWTDGPGEHRRAVEKQIEVLRQRLESCNPEEREQLSGELDQAVEDLTSSRDDQILW